MTKKILILTFVFAFSLTLSKGQNAARLYKKCLPSIVKISVLNIDGTASEGTGFFIGEKTIITCYHVVDNVNTIKIETRDRKKYTVDNVIASDHKADVIKFTVKESNTSWLKLSDKLPEIGESVFIIGNPDDYDFSISNGIVSAIRMKNNVQIIQNTAASSQGSSGSPLLDKKGNVIGVMSYIKYIGQSLNFATSSLHIIKFENDNTITQLKPITATITEREMDSIIVSANQAYTTKDYNKALNAILPITKFADSAQAIQFTEIIGNCHLFLSDYTKAAQYYDVLIKNLQAIKKHTPEHVCKYAETLFKISTCYYILGNKEEAIKILAKTADVCKEGLDNDPIRKAIYTTLIQNVYSSDAAFKYSLNKTFEACLSWRLAKQYGYPKNDYDLDSICK